MRVTWLFAPADASKQHLLLTGHGGEKQGGALLLIGSQRDRLPLIVNHRLAVLVEEGRLQPQPTRGLARLLAINESNAVQKQRGLAIALHDPIDAIHHVGIKVDHRRAEDAPKNIDAVEIDGSSAMMLTGFLHLGRTKRLADGRFHSRSCPSGASASNAKM